MAGVRAGVIAIDVGLAAFMFALIWLASDYSHELAGMLLFCAGMLPFVYSMGNVKGSSMARDARARMPHGKRVPRMLSEETNRVDDRRVFIGFAAAVPLVAIGWILIQLGDIDRL